MSQELLVRFFDNQDLPEGRMSTYARINEELDTLKEAGLEKTVSYCTTLWSSIDLMARFYSGQLVNRNSTGRISRYLRGPMSRNGKNSEILLLFRHACTHGLGMYAFDATRKTEVRFSLSTQSPDLITKIGSSHFRINPHLLRNLFQKSVENYRGQLEQDEELLKKFAKVYRKLGYAIIYQE
ncbi:hypothetical protein KFE98_04225 [bacterium SCSIO 12741]|nr:hypothetical protein KFE98_04225 [bacterium SCSIO 12741]